MIDAPRPSAPSSSLPQAAPPAPLPTPPPAPQTPANTTSLSRTQHLREAARHLDAAGYETAAAEFRAAADALHELANDHGNTEKCLTTIQDREHVADDVIRDVLTTVRRTFLTPFDRGAITSLIGAMDDAIDEMLAAARAIDLYEMENLRQEMKDIVTIIVEAARVTNEAIPLLRNVSKNGADLAGMAGKMPGAEDIPDGWTVYLAVPDIQATVDAVTAAGGQVFFEPMAIGDQGSMAIISDPSGAFVGLWQPAQRQGFERFGEHGAPAWFELLTRDFDAASAFYSAVLGVELAKREPGTPQRITVDVA